jgi:hypothetical protein
MTNITPIFYIFYGYVFFNYHAFKLTIYFLKTVFTALKPRELSSEMSNNAQINSEPEINSDPEPESGSESDSDPDYIPPIKKNYFLRKRK